MILEAKNLTFRYPRQQGAPALERVSLTLEPGEQVGLSAPSGWEKPDSGQVLLDGLPVTGYRGFCPVQLLWQHPEEAVDPLLHLGTTLRQAGTVDRAVLDGLGIQDSWLERYPSELSGGELQRICVARVLRPQLRFLLCDEASAMLDLITQARLWQFLLAQAEARRLGLLVVSHDTQLLKRLCPRILSWTELTL